MVAQDRTAGFSGFSLVAGTDGLLVSAEAAVVVAVVEDSAGDEGTVLCRAVFVVGQHMVAPGMLAAAEIPAGTEALAGAEALADAEILDVARALADSETLIFAEALGLAVAADFLPGRSVYRVFDRQVDR
ncbi:hypothetical protein PG994_008026 [Apiospora phragmitis]|uniref:Uncharacterized protein n=1 Tax=Apiospora phragmitis TaxID=2905665 RepID=A0ABR1URW1_9PEZI